MKIVNFGSLNIDYVYNVDAFIRPGETKSAKNREIFCGGKGLNQSIACAKAGLDIYHVGLIGIEGSFLTEKLVEYNVKTDFIRQIEENTGHAIIQVNGRGENCILLYPGTNKMLTDSFVEEVLENFTSDDVVMLQNETNMVGEIITMAAKKGMRIVFNAAPFTNAIKEYPIDQVTWLFVNEIEGAALSGEMDNRFIAQKLREIYPETEIILTLGTEGCIYSGGDGRYKVPCEKVVPVDTTAAGDTFTGYYLKGAISALGAKRSLEIATAASAVTVTRPGAADAIPYWDELSL